MSSQRQLMDEADLVGVHEAGIAHHVAAVGQVDRQDRSAAVVYGAAAVVVELFVVVCADVTAREDVLQMIEERGVHRHHVFKVAVLRAILHHQDLAVALDDLRLDFANLLDSKGSCSELAIDDLLPDLRNALRDRANRSHEASLVAALSSPTTSAMASPTTSA